jgi:hypothetical protein
VGAVKRFILGIILGIILGVVFFVLFLFFGGSEYLKRLGQKTIDTGVKLERYEEELKQAAEQAKGVVKETREKTGEKAKETFEGTKEKVREYMPE